MPYIKQEERVQYQSHIMEVSKILSENDWNVGHVNFIISCLLKRWWRNNTSYATINSITGVLACIGEEFYRKYAVPYERKKQKENGDLS